MSWITAEIAAQFLTRLTSSAMNRETATTARMTRCTRTLPLFTCQKSTGQGQLNVAVSQIRNIDENR